MLRLVLRDVLVGRRLAAVLALFYVLYLAIAVRLPELYLLTTFFFTAGFALSGTLLDGQRGAEALWASLPLARATIVRGRYAAVVAIGAACLTVSWMVGLLAAAPMGAERPPLPVAVYAALLVMLALLAALFLPFHFKLGPGRGLSAFLATVAGLLLVTAVVSQVMAWLLGSPHALLEAATWRSAGRIAVGDTPRPIGISATALLGGTLTISAALYLLSMRIAEQFYRERDL